MLDGSKLRLEDTTFRNAVQLAINYTENNNYQPLKATFETTKKILYFDTQVFNAFLNNEITLPEAIKKTECDGLFRNSKEIFKNKTDCIDPEWLWKKQGEFLYLINDDETVQCIYDTSYFYEV